MDSIFPNTENQAAPQAQPFANAAAPTPPEAPQAAPTAPTAPTEAPQAAPQASAGDESAEKKPRKKVERKATREINQDDINYVLTNIKNQSYKEMADHLGLTKSQINRILMETKKNLRERAKGNEEAMAKVEQFIKEKLSRPEDAFGGTKKNAAVRNAINSVVEDIISSL